MEIDVLGKDFLKQGAIDNYESLLWAVRYNKMGDFKLTMPMDVTVRAFTKQNPYLTIQDDDHVMVVEEQTVEVDASGAATLALSGRSLESFLARRIIWNRISHNGKLIDLFNRIINESITNPTLAIRKIEGFMFSVTAPSNKVDATVDKQYLGESVYAVFEELCGYYGLGFKMDLYQKNPRLIVYNGSDYSYAAKASGRPYVAISPKFDNLLSSKTEWSNKEFKTIALVGGEGEDTARRFAFSGGDKTGSETGWDRRELFIDARDIQSKVNNTQLTTAQYNALLGARAKTTLKQTVPTTKVDGVIDPAGLYAVNYSWYLGDIIQVENGYGDGYRARVDELVYTRDREGYRVSPTFKNLDIPEE